MTEESKSKSIVKSVAKEATIFDFTASKEKNEAFQNLISGKTPLKEVKQRDGRGGTTLNYVNTYYMIRQVALLTGWRWNSECLEERFFPEDKPREVGAKMKVTIWDTQGKEYSHISWGQKDISKWSKDNPTKGQKTGDPIAIFDDLKAAYSDGIKKCLSYFGIAADIYGGKELEFFADDSEDSEGAVIVDFAGDEAKKAFSKYIEKIGKRWSEVFEVLEVKSLAEVTDYKNAYNQIKAWYEKED